MSDTDAPLWCVVPAAGRGSRFGGEIPKQYMTLRGKPLLLLTLERLAVHPRIAGLMVPIAENDRHWPGISTCAGKPVVSTTGGARRPDSVLAGLLALRAKVSDVDFVLVHDAARPCVLAADIDRLISLGVAAGGALLAAPLRDTLKRADAGGRVEATEQRGGRWRALTPQLFRLGELITALQAAHVAGVEATDEAMAMERLGHRPLLVEGAQSNIKVTTPADLVLAELLLEQASGSGSARGENVA